MILYDLPDDTFLKFQLEYGEHPKVLDAYLGIECFNTILLGYVSVKGDPEKLSVITIHDEASGEHFLPIREGDDFELTYAMKTTKAISGNYLTRQAIEKLDSELVSVVESSNGIIRFVNK